MGQNPVETRRSRASLREGIVARLLAKSYKRRPVVRGILTLRRVKP
jgi:hypothetical protein